jgi:hypothetical protein
MTLTVDAMRRIAALKFIGLTLAGRLPPSMLWVIGYLGPVPAMPK